MKYPVKLLKYKKTGYGNSVISDSFSLNNAIGEIPSEVVITYVQNNNGNIRFSYNLSGEVYFPCDLKFSYSFDGLEWLESENISEDVKQVVQLPETGEKFLDWNTGNDIENNATVSVRLQPSFTVSNGSITEKHFGIVSETSEIFINNLDIPKVRIEDIIIKNHESVTIKYIVNYHGPWKIKVLDEMMGSGRRGRLY